MSTQALTIHSEIVQPGQKANGEKYDIGYGWHSSPFGSCFIAASKQGICQLSFTDPENEEPIKTLAARWPEAMTTPQQKNTQGLVEKVFAGQEALALHLRGSEFQIEVWQALLAIPRGELSNYQQIARAINRPKAYRAVGSAVGANPIGFIIPCHRVILSSGELGNYHWGVKIKEAMLNWEQQSLVK